jgi:hypothetical protein
MRSVHEQRKEGNTLQLYTLFTWTKEGGEHFTTVCALYMNKGEEGNTLQLYALFTWTKEGGEHFTTVCALYMNKGRRGTLYNCMRSLHEQEREREGNTLQLYALFTWTKEGGEHFTTVCALYMNERERGEHFTTVCALYMNKGRRGTLYNCMRSVHEQGRGGEHFTTVCALYINKVMK